MPSLRSLTDSIVACLLIPGIVASSGTAQASALASNAPQSIVSAAEIAEADRTVEQARSVCVSEDGPAEVSASEVEHVIGTLRDLLANLPETSDTHFIRQVALLQAVLCGRDHFPISARHNHEARQMYNEYTAQLAQQRIPLGDSARQAGIRLKEWADKTRAAEYTRRHSASTPPAGPARTQPKPAATTVNQPQFSSQGPANEAPPQSQTKQAPRDRVRPRPKRANTKLSRQPRSRPKRTTASVARGQLLAGRVLLWSSAATLIAGSIAWARFSNRAEAVKEAENQKEHDAISQQSLVASTLAITFYSTALVFFTVGAITTRAGKSKMQRLRVAAGPTSLRLMGRF